MTRQAVADAVFWIGVGANGLALAVNTWLLLRAQTAGSALMSTAGIAIALMGAVIPVGTRIWLRSVVGKRDAERLAWLAQAATADAMTVDIRAAGVGVDDDPPPGRRM